MHARNFRVVKDWHATWILPSVGPSAAALAMGRLAQRGTITSAPEKVMNSEGGLTEAQQRQFGMFMDAACSVIPRLYSPACCLAATRIAVEVLGRFDFSVRPLVVKVAVHNPALVAKGRLPASNEEARRWREEDNAAVAVCGAQGAGRHGHWPGHLVAIVAERCLIDLSLPQVNRADRDIALTPLLCKVESAFLAGTARLAFLLNHCRVVYDALPDDRSFDGIGDWHDAAMHREAIEAIYWGMRRYIAGGSHTAGVPVPGYRTKIDVTWTSTLI
jgi:hypothetical protein